MTARKKTEQYDRHTVISAIIHESEGVSSFIQPFAMAINRQISVRSLLGSCRHSRCGSGSLFSPEHVSDSGALGCKPSCCFSTTDVVESTRSVFNRTVPHRLHERSEKPHHFGWTCCRRRWSNRRTTSGILHAGKYSYRQEPPRSHGKRRSEDSVQTCGAKPARPTRV